ncbi:TetR/AcrR family transcriptional regulator [Nocardia cyriacigeorgica]|uniref:TetR/AcrR family transcriptional regulator n=1 Tax=Nocardia cyriacigeorgica TaxID=135487 RepID=UPI002457B758|nr:TetR/AcrR family transcriptional regulator [Nocardia cyriacigeorgica]
MSDAPTPRAARSRSAILRAAVDLCAEHGFAAVTMEAIAARAEVGKPTVYRWWRSKSAVLLDALLEIWAAPVVPLPASGDGDVVADLRRWLYGFVDTFNDPTLRPVVIGVLGAAQLDPELKASIRERVHTPLRADNQTRIVAAQRAGQLPDVDPELLEDSLVAPLWYRLLVSDEPIDRAYADAVLAAALR